MVVSLPETNLPFIRRTVVNLQNVIQIDTKIFFCNPHQCRLHQFDSRFNRLLKNVFEAADARQKQVKKRSLCLINEHLESVFNAAAATQIVFQRPVYRTLLNTDLSFTLHFFANPIHVLLVYLAYCNQPDFQ